MPDVIVLYNKTERVIEALQKAKNTLFPELRQVVAIGIPDLDNDPVVMCVGFDIWSSNAPDIQIIVIISNSDKRWNTAEQVTENLARRINKLFTEWRQTDETPNELWPLLSLKIEVLTIMSPGFWLNVEKE